MEETLLRSDDRSFCIINQGSPRAIVMGISGDPESHLNVEAVRKDRIPVIKRFSGGGTVIVDENTLFITFIMAKDHLDLPAFPEPILRWSADIYSKAWQIPEFNLRENDYCIGEKKCGGNAQYIKKDRWLHHTSFLLDYSDHNMNYLKLPAKRPKYRQDRPHHEFLTKLKTHGHDWDSKLNTYLLSVNQFSGGPMFDVKRLYISDFDSSVWDPKPCRQSVHLIEV